MLYSYKSTLYPITALPPVPIEILTTPDVYPCWSLKYPLVPTEILATNNAILPIIGKCL